MADEATLADRVRWILRAYKRGCSHGLPGECVHCAHAALVAIEHYHGNVGDVEPDGFAALVSARNAKAEG